MTSRPQNSPPCPPSSSPPSSPSSRRLTFSGRLRRRLLQLLLQDIPLLAQRLGSPLGLHRALLQLAPRHLSLHLSLGARHTSSIQLLHSLTQPLLQAGVGRLQGCEVGVQGTGW
jgi:hypothetical protein